MTSEDNNPIDFLIVDDEDLMHMFVSRMLRTSGQKNILCVSSANEALRVMRSRSVRFLITDWLMPGTTGIELIRVVREDPLLFSTPIIMLTGVCTAAGVMCAIEEGADGYVVKPFTADKLLKTISSIMQKRANPLQSRISEMTRLKLLGDYTAALEIGEKILKESRDPNVLFMVGECLRKNNQFQDAVVVLTESARTEKCGKSHNLLGKIFMEQGDQERGIGHLELASEECPLLQKRKVDLAEAFFHAGREREAELVIDVLVKSDPTNLILADLGKIYLEQGDIERAGTFLKEGVTPTPETVPIFNNYAIALKRRGLFEESEAIYKKCIDLVPDSFVLYFNAGMVSEKMKKYERAKQMFEHALRLNPSYEPARICLESLKL
ncbi:MAG: response regulator [Syntrophobacteraceae bacterium]